MHLLHIMPFSISNCRNIYHQLRGKTVWFGACSQYLVSKALTLVTATA